MLLVGCATVSTNSEYIEINKANVEIKKGFSFSEIADSTLYVALETKPECLIGNVEDLQCVDNKLFILNKIGDYEEVLVFNNKGVFLTKIGQRGQGPGEYLSVSAIGINKYEKYLVLIDPLKKQIHKYDYNGKYMSSLPALNECAYIRSVRYVSRTRIRYVSLINPSTPTLIAESDENLGNMKTLWKTGYRFNGGFKFADTPISTNGDYFILPLTYSIYNYSDGELTPAIKLDIQNKFTPDEEIEKDDNIRDIYIGAIKKGFMPINSIVSYGNYLLICQLNGNSVLWNLKTRSGNYFDYVSLTPMSDEIRSSGISKIVGFANGFIALLPADQLLSVKSQYEKLNSEVNVKLKKIPQNVDVEDNPIVCFYYLP